MSIRRIAVAGVLLAALAIPSIVFAQARMKVLLDTDIGTDIDDAWALGLLIASPDVELVGVTITDGDTAARAKVACKLLHVSGRDEVPVAVGRPHGTPRSAWTTSSPGPRSSPPSSPSPSPPPTSSSTRCARIPAKSRSSPSGRCRTSPTRSGRSRTSAQLAKRVVLMSGSIGGNAWSPVAGGRVERGAIDRRRAAGVRHAADDDRAARLDHLRHAQARGAGAPPIAQLAAHSRARGAVPALAERSVARA